MTRPPVKRRTMKAEYEQNVRAMQLGRLRAAVDLACVAIRNAEGARKALFPTDDADLGLTTERLETIRSWAWSLKAEDV